MYKKRPLERSLKWQAKLAIWRCLAEWGNRKALRLEAQGVYSCKWRGLNIDNNAASALLCNGIKKRRTQQK